VSDERFGGFLLITAEHGGNEVPPEHKHLFESHEEALRSHRGWDPGTRILAESLAARLGAPTITSTLTRLLVDLNRSAHNPRVFSEITRPLSRRERVSLLERYHRPHWDLAREAVTAGLARHGTLLHLGIHSFTPSLDGVVRKPDLALLYDPSSPEERALATRWAEALAAELPDRVVRRNNPYLGSNDGMTTAFRRSFPRAGYLGLEVEVNQKHIKRDGSFPAWVADALLSTLPEGFRP